MLLILFLLLNCLPIVDAIVNPNSNVLNFISILLIAHIYEYYCQPHHDIAQFTIWVVALLGILTVFNFIKKNKPFKYSTLVILCTILVFKCTIQYIGDTNFNKNAFNKIGYQNKKCTIPRKYDELKIVIGGIYNPVFRAVQNKKVIYIDCFDKNIFPYAQSVEFVGYAGTANNLFFKVKENNKYGFYMYVQYNGQPAELNALIPNIYDNIKITKTFINLQSRISPNMYNIPFIEDSIIAVIAKKGNLYDLYILSEKDQNWLYTNSADPIKYDLYLKNQKDINKINKTINRAEQRLLREIHNKNIKTNPYYNYSIVDKKYRPRFLGIL